MKKKLMQQDQKQFIIHNNTNSKVKSKGTSFLDMNIALSTVSPLILEQDLVTNTNNNSPKSKLRSPGSITANSIPINFNEGTPMHNTVPFNVNFNGSSITDSINVRVVRTPKSYTCYDKKQINSLRTQNRISSDAMKDTKSFKPSKPLCLPSTHAWMKKIEPLNQEFTDRPFELSSLDEPLSAKYRNHTRRVQSSQGERHRTQDITANNVKKDSYRYKTTRKKQSLKTRSVLPNRPILHGEITLKEYVAMLNDEKEVIIENEKSKDPRKEIVQPTIEFLRVEAEVSKKEDFLPSFTNFMPKHYLKDNSSRELEYNEKKSNALQSPSRCLTKGMLKKNKHWSNAVSVNMPLKHKRQYLKKADDYNW
eukprot:TRINITY_DN1023_c0_g1_i1.p1 TRINITY_DN1023_c0_g1~~TRINITY_DN1023_c0_g1_i1.p1  ORF type:complete len:365 (-),score=87.53 TRINITY_DN1023_c0_g1_i1:30-1124(-)